jgi:RNA polymerase sigma-70 factor (ECF subfamily)
MVPRSSQRLAKEETDVVTRAQCGDRDAFRELVEAHEQQVFGSIVRLTGDREISRDLAQETFIRAFRSLRQFSGRAQFSTWLTTIAANVTKSFWASRAFTERAHSVPLEPARHGAGAIDRSHETLEVERRLSALREAIRLLSPQHREVVVLCWLEQRSYGEVAEVLGIPYGTVCSRLHAALKALRTTIQRIEGAE